MNLWVVEIHSIVSVYLNQLKINNLKVLEIVFNFNYAFFNYSIVNVYLNRNQTNVTYFWDHVFLKYFELF